MTPTQALLHNQRKERMARLGMGPPPPKAVEAPAPPVPQIVPEDPDKCSVTSMTITPVPETAHVVTIVEDMDAFARFERPANRKKLTVRQRRELTRARRDFDYKTTKLALEEILKDVIKRSPSNVTADLVRSYSRHKAVVAARIWFYYRAVTETAASYPRVAEVAGVLDHTTVMYGVSRYCMLNGIPMPRTLNSGKFYARVKAVIERARLRREAKRQRLLPTPEDDLTGQGLLALEPPSSASQAAVPPLEGREAHPPAQNVAGQALQANANGRISMTPRASKAKSTADPLPAAAAATKYDQEAQYRIKLSSVVKIPGGYLRPGDGNVVIGWVAESIDWAIISSEKVG